MTKEEFKFETSRIDAEIKVLREQASNIKDAYIKEHAKFEIGDKVVVIYPATYGPFPKPEKREYGFVCKNELNFREDVVPKLLKCKKDGTESRHELYVWSYEDVIIEKAKL